MQNNKTFGYYFLNTRLHPPTNNDYKVSIVLVIINKNKTNNKDKFLFVQQKNLFWNLPKKGIKSKIITEDIYTTISKNLEHELGFKGVKVAETKPFFRQIAFIFDFEKQIYDEERSKAEDKKDNPKKGKIYQLALMEYRGTDDLPVSIATEISDYKWVNLEEAQSLLLSNKDLLNYDIINSNSSVDFNIKLFKKISVFYQKMSEAMDNDQQSKLF